MVVQRHCGTVSSHANHYYGPTQDSMGKNASRDQQCPQRTAGQSTGYRPTEMKAMVIGIDSASPVLIEKWKDSLPNLRSIMDHGAYGVLKSIVPPESVPAWQCFATGKNPAKIGLFGFSYIGRDRKLRHGRTTPDLGCFWDICSNRGLKVGVFNVPGTYPAYPVNGFMVCGFPVPTRAAWAYPKTLMKRLDKAVGGYEIDVPVTKPSDLKGGEEAYLPQVDRLHTKCLEAAKALLGWFHPDVFMMTFQGIDLVHHDFWRYMDDQNSPYRNVLRDWYVKMDHAVQELRQFATADTNLLLLSDHGSAPASAALYVNEYLAENGMLKTNNHVKQSGDVAQSELRDKLINMMGQLIDPTTGEKVRPIFHLREDTFKGPFQDEAPDLCVELYSGDEKIQISPRLGTGKLWSLSPHFSSIHTREGFWALEGPNVKQGLRLDAGLLDLAPTLLQLLGFEPSTDFDGKILDSALAVAHPNEGIPSSRDVLVSNP